MSPTCRWRFGIVNKSGFRVALESITEDNVSAEDCSDFCVSSLLESVSAKLADLERMDCATSEKLSSNRAVVTSGGVSKDVSVVSTRGEPGSQPILDKPSRSDPLRFVLILEKTISILPVILLLIIVAYLIFSILVYANCMGMISNISHVDFVNMVKFFGIGVSSVTSVFVLMTLSYISGKRIANLDKIREVEQAVNEERESLRREKELFMNYRKEEYADISRRLLELDERTMSKVLT